MGEEKEKVITDLKSTISELQNRLVAHSSEIDMLRQEVSRLKTEKFTLLKDKELLTKENKFLKDQITKLEAEKKVLDEQIQRPKVSPENLMLSFKDAMVRMEAGLKSEKMRVDYTLKTFDVELKANINLDKENKLFIQMPFLSELVPPENLSVLKFSISAVPKSRVPLITVPNVIGRMKDSAMEIIETAGLKASVTEKPSSSPKGMVIGQDPEAYSEVPAETEIVLTIAKPETVKVPNIIGMEKNIAIKVLESSQLSAGKTEERISDAAPGIIISQNPQPDTTAEVGSKVDIVISTKGIEVPNLIGKTEEKAKELIKKNNLLVGSVSYSPSLFHGRVLSQTPSAGVKVLPETSVNFKVGKEVSIEDLTKLFASFPEAKKFGIDPQLIFYVIKTFEINTRKNLDEFLKLSDKTIQEKLKLKAADMAIAIKEILKKLKG